MSTRKSLEEMGRETGGPAKGLLGRRRGSHPDCGEEQKETR